MKLYDFALAFFVPVLVACQSTGLPTPTATTMPRVNTASPTATVVESTSTPAPTHPATPASFATAVAETPTLTPTETPQTAVTAVAQASVSVSASRPVNVFETIISLPTYPYADYLVESVEATYNLPIFYLNRAEYEASNPSPTMVDYQAVVLENDHLRLTFLPQLGGRLYSAVIKQTGQELFYHNPVVKPSVYGPLAPINGDNPNWWLATGGMEWAYPVHEHGYRWGVPWRYDVRQNASGATITLSDVDEGRVGAEVALTLPRDGATFSVKPSLINGTQNNVPIQFWLNAALALAPNSLALDTQFVVPVESVIVHSRGAEGWNIPDARAKLSWPISMETDLRTYNTWANYLGFFIPDLPAPFIGAYNPETDLGIARLIEPNTVPGSKLFAFGQHFPDKSYTDDGSQYFELWGGVNHGFWAEDDLLIAPGETISWQEAWWPLAQLGGLTWANEHIALHVSRQADAFSVTARVAQPTVGEVRIIDSQNQTQLVSERYDGQPSSPLRWQFNSTAQAVTLQFINQDEQLLLEYLYQE